MIPKDKHLRLALTLLVLNLTVIWGNSLLPGDISGFLSGSVRDLLAGLFPGDVPAESGHGLLRKLGHFTEFTCLGLILSRIMGLLAKPIPLALAGGFAAACIDESIQIFVPGRCSAFTDVLIDTSGVLTGILLLLLLRRLRRKNHSS